MKIRIIAFLMCLFIAAGLLSGCSNKDTEGPDMTETQVQSTFTDISEVESSVSTPDEKPADVNNIEGFTPEKINGGVVTPVDIEDGPLVISATGSYTGRFVEDGTDEAVENISAVIVRNSGDKPVQHATLNLTAENGEMYNFVISVLPAGCSVLVLEENKKPYETGLYMCSVSAEVTVCEELEKSKDRVRVSFDGTNLHVRNLTDKDFRAVYVRYKNYTAGNVYLGGITYNASFDNVAANSESVFESAHFYSGGSQVLMVQIVE